MRPADRLFQIVLMLRHGRVVTARALAEALEVSERTIYRDIADLIQSGAPIDGEAGVGYRLRRGYQVPPLMFTGEELEALAIGAKLVGAWADPALGKAAEMAMAVLREGMEHGRKVSVAYRRGDGEFSQRILWPLGLVFWGRCWTLGAWCELRQTFRTFRVDRIERVELLESGFDDRYGHLWEEYLARARSEAHERRRGPAEDAT